jgi:aminoglycoside 3-N-acetyltransferase
MKTIDFIYKVIPNDWFRKLSRRYYKFVKKWMKKMNEEEFLTFLRTKLNVQSGDIVFVHSAMSKMNVTFPPKKMLELLKESVGEEGTLLFPCWHYTGRAEDYLRKHDSVFDVTNSKTTLGFLNQLAKNEPGAFRSWHPTVSVCAIGKRAEELTNQHHTDIFPCGEKSPWFLMLQYPSKIIGLGEKVVSLSFVHCVEDVMKEQFPLATLSEEVLNGKVITPDGNTLQVPTRFPQKGIKQRDVVSFFSKNIPKFIGQQFRYHGVNYFRCDALKLYQKMEQLAQNGKTIYHF